MGSAAQGERRWVVWETGWVKWEKLCLRVHAELTGFPDTTAAGQAEQGLLCHENSHSSSLPRLRGGHGQLSLEPSAKG